MNTEGIKQNYLGALLETDTNFWYSLEKEADPLGVEERVYHAFSKDWISNEIFRRVEPKGRTMAEYLREEFPEVDVFSGLKPAEQDRVQDLRG